MTKKKVGGAGHKVMLLMEGKAHAYVFPSPGDIIHIKQAIISSAGDIIHIIQAIISSAGDIIHKKNNEC